MNQSTLGHEYVPSVKPKTTRGLTWRNGVACRAAGRKLHQAVEALGAGANENAARENLQETAIPEAPQGMAQGFENVDFAPTRDSCLSLYFVDANAPSFAYEGALLRMRNSSVNPDIQLVKPLRW